MVKDVKKAVEKLRSLPYREGSYTSRAWGHKLHSLCSYPSKIKPAIAHVLIKEFTNPNDRVLDPFSGIGTIPLEACLQGRIGLASDLNPLAWWGSLAKTSFPPKDSVDAVINDIEKLVYEIDTKKTLANYPIEDEIALFFQEKTRAEILIVRDFLINCL